MSIQCLPAASNEVEVQSSSIHEVAASALKKGSSKQRNYVLNDVGALKKKITHEKRLSNYTIWKEAKDCSNVVIQMRASFFEFVKACFIEELESNPNITSIENAERAKASTESNGDAYVEYSLEISFVSQSNSHTIKLTAYTTTSQLMIQPINEKVRT